MTISARSILMAGVTTATVGAVAIAPSVQPATAPRPEVASTVQLAAQTVKLPDKAALTAWLAALQRQSPNAVGAVQPFAAQAAPTAELFAFPGLGNAIISAYNIIEPWVAYGVDVADWALGWIPLGWLIGDQINIFYDSLEPAVQSIFYNIGWWVGGSISFWDGLSNVILDGANAFIGLLNAEIRYGFGFLPPLPFGPPQIPYLPWFGLLTQTAPTSADALAPEVGVQNVASDLVNAIYYPVRNTIDYGVSVFQDVLAPIPVVRIVGDQTELLWDNLVLPISDSVVLGAIDPILNAPLNINSYINGVYNVGATTVNSLINTGFAEANYFLGGPFSAQANAEKSTEFKTAEVSSVPSLVKSTLGGARAYNETPRPLAEVAKTVRNVRTEIRSAITERTDDAKDVRGAADDGGNTVVRTQGAARGPLTKAISDVRKAARSAKPDSVVAEVANAPRSIVKSLSDTAKKVVKDVKQAAKDPRKAAKDGPAGEAAA